MKLWMLAAFTTFVSLPAHATLELMAFAGKPGTREAVCESHSSEGVIQKHTLRWNKSGKDSGRLSINGEPYEANYTRQSLAADPIFRVNTKGKAALPSYEWNVVDAVHEQLDGQEADLLLSSGGSDNWFKGYELRNCVVTEIGEKD